MLTVNGLRDILAAGVAWPESDVSGYLCALQLRRILPADDDTPVNAAQVAATMLALVSGLPAQAAAIEALRLSLFRATGTSLRHEQGGQVHLATQALPAPGATL